MQISYTWTVYYLGGNKVAGDHRLLTEFRKVNMKNGTELENKIASSRLYEW